MHSPFRLIFLILMLGSLGGVAPRAWAADAPAKINEGVGTDLKKFGEEVAQRVDRIVKKKAFDLWGDPWTIQGIPLIFPTSTNGFNLGLKVALQDIRRQDPHKLEFEAQVLTSDKGRYKHFFKVDYPHAFDGKFRITTKAGYDRDVAFSYFGTGNNTVIDKDALSRDAVIYQNVRAGPGFNFQIFRYIGKHVRLGPMLGLKWTQITAPSGSLLEAQQPLGIGGGRTHSVGFGLVYETLDFEPYPSSGNFHEFYVNWYSPWIGSEFNYQRFTYTFRRYWPLHRTMILATRTLFEVLSGDVPYYEMGAVGGSDSTLALGGDRFMRGWESNRFLDRIRLFVGFELRWDPLTFYFAKQEVSLGFVPFFDIGRVWPTVFPVEVNTLHASTGWGVRMVWDNRFIIRTDFALNSEGTSLYVELGSSF